MSFSLSLHSWKMALFLSAPKEKRYSRRVVLRNAFLFLAALAVFHSQTSSLEAAEGGAVPPRNEWSFRGLLGVYDRAQLQRGLKVFQEVCTTCHSANLLTFRNLYEKGGPEFSKAQIKALIADYDIPYQDETGELSERPARSYDHFPAPYPTSEAAKAALGAAPPDLSVIAKARSFSRGLLPALSDVFTLYQEQGPDYLVALLTGYHEPPKGVKLSAGQYYNTYFPGNVIAMAPPLSDELVAYPDGTPETVESYAKDISAFLMWAAEPKMEERKRIGAYFMLLMAFLAISLYYTKKKVWSDVKKKK